MLNYLSAVAAGYQQRLPWPASAQEPGSAALRRPVDRLGQALRRLCQPDLLGSARIGETGLQRVARQLHRRERRLGQLRRAHARGQLAGEELQQRCLQLIENVEQLLGSRSLVQMDRPSWAADRLRAAIRRWRRLVADAQQRSETELDLSILQAALLEVAAALSICVRLALED